MKNPSMKKLAILAMEFCDQERKIGRTDESIRVEIEIIKDFLNWVWVNQSDNKYYRKEKPLE